MANNRMYLRNTRTGKMFYLAKYYPSAGWYSQTTEIKRDLTSELDAWFDSQESPYTPMGGEYELALETSDAEWDETEPRERLAGAQISVDVEYAATIRQALEEFVEAGGGEPARNALEAFERAAKAIAVPDRE